MSLDDFVGQGRSVFGEEQKKMKIETKEEGQKERVHETAPHVNQIESTSINRHLHSGLMCVQIANDPNGRRQDQIDIMEGEWRCRTKQAQSTGTAGQTVIR